MANSHVGDIGTAFRVTIKDVNDEVEDVSSSTTRLLIFKKPDKTVVTHEAEFYTDGTDGIIQFVTETVDDLDQSGRWTLQAYVETPDGSWHTETGVFRVDKNLE